MGESPRQIKALGGLLCGSEAWPSCDGVSRRSGPASGHFSGLGYIDPLLAA